MENQNLNGRTLLVVDDEVDLRDIVSSELEFMGAKVFQAENIKKAQEILNQENIDLIVSDIRMPGGTGIELLEHVKNKNVEIPPVILITGFADITVEGAFNKGAEALVNKPFKLDDLIKLTVKFTEPLKKRFSEIVSPSRVLSFNYSTSINEKLNQGSLMFGRGGMSVNVEADKQKCESGDIVKFNFNFKDLILEGIAICRWSKSSEQSGKKPSLGLEFLQLNEETLKFFTNYIEKNLPKPYIPSID